MKLRCSRCHQLKPDDHFAWRRTLFGQRDSYCRPCRSAYKKEHYAKNKKRYIKQARDRARREIPMRMEWLVQYLEDHPCVDCGEVDPVVLQLDHRGDKSFDIGNGIRYRKWSLILKEIDLCDVRCANCHRRRTASQGGFMRAALLAAGDGDGQATD